MMMSKPSASASSAEDDEKKPAPLNKQGAAEAVADLERRLADLSGTAEQQQPVVQQQQQPPPFAAAAPPPATAAAAPAAAGGKNALLVSICYNCWNCGSFLLLFFRRTNEMQ